MNPDHLKLFIRIASTLNISQAGEELGLSPAVASAHINKLEQGLGVRLLHRTTRQVTLSEEGRVFLPYAEDVLAGIEAAKAAVGIGQASPIGTVRVTASAAFGRQHLIPAIKAFLEQHPKVQVDLCLSDNIVDMVEGGFDVALRSAALEDSSFFARKLAVDRRIVCASPEYIAEHGAPATPQDLVHHQCISFRNLDNWAFHTSTGKLHIKTHGRLRTDNGEAMRDACRAGMGLTINSTWNVYEYLLSGELVEILPDFPLARETAIWAVYPSSRLLAPRVKLFIDFLANWFGEIPYWEEALSRAATSDKK